MMLIIRILAPCLIISGCYTKNMPCEMDDYKVWSVSGKGWTERGALLNARENCNKLQNAYN